MGKLEKRNRKKKRNKNIQKMVLESVAAAGVLSVALVAPNVIGAMRKLNIPLSVRQDATITRARRRLIEKGMLAYEKGSLRLTKKGKVRLTQMSFIHYRENKKKRRWDKRWRMLVFDIPEKKRALRDKVRNTLVAIGFMRLQDSVWIYPYDCEDLITLIKAELRIGKDVLYAIVEDLEHDKPVRDFFGLK